MGQFEEEPLSDLEQFWADLLSGQPMLIAAVWATLDPEERVAIHAHLIRIQTDPERLAEQRQAAEIALSVIGSP